MQNYLKKCALYPQWIEDPVSDSLAMVLVIPCYNEDDLLSSLRSIDQCTISHDYTAEVIIVINHGISESLEIKTQNEKTINQTHEWIKQNKNTAISYHIIKAFDLPQKKAGVGLARKIGMDEALFRYLEINKTDGIIVCYDADSKCRANFLDSIYEYFNHHNKVQAVSIHYEHPLSGNEYSEAVYQCIIQYELHLRYYIEMQRFLMVPYGYHTVGSSMAVRAMAYAKVGGMNQRKAGEDFYFIHKFIKSFNFGEIHDTTVFPAPRLSDRVPFGTGRAITEMIDNSDYQYLSYHPQSFYDLDDFFTQLSDIYETGDHEELDMTLQNFLNQVDYKSRIAEIKSNTTDYISFYKRFYRWFDAFLLMKYLHYRRSIDLPDIPVIEATGMHFWELRSMSALDQLLHLRERQLLRD